jgi:2-polyprenyl-3-methyl-5-hydroxy-6-metoxy-1,4-benzoquinol methylase
MKLSNPSDQPWPPAGLERVERCPVCQSPERHLLYDHLTDRVFFCAPGEWTLYTCSQCQSAYLDPRPTPETIGLAYSNYFTHEEPTEKTPSSSFGRFKRRLRNGYLNAKYKCNLQPSSPLGRWVTPLLPQKRTQDEIYRRLPTNVHHGRVADIGCGNGDFLRKAIQLGWEAWGTDVDEKALTVAKQSGARVIAGNLPNTGLPSDYFDYVTMSHVIEHVHDPLAALKEAHRILKPGGTLWIATPNLNSLSHKKFGKNWFSIDSPRHLIIFNMQSMQNIIQKSGFKKLHFFPCAAHSIGISRSSLHISMGKNPFDKSIQKMHLKMSYVGLINDINGLINKNKNETIILTALCDK